MPPLVRMRSVVSLLIISLAVNCHATSMQGQQLMDNSVVMANPAMPSDEDMKFFLSESKYRQHSSLFFSKARPPPLEPEMSSDNVLTPTHNWAIYFTTDGMFQDLRLANRNAPVIRLSSKAAVDAFRQGDWVHLNDGEQLADPQAPMQWVRCQHKSTSPSVMDIVRDTGRAIIQTRDQLTDALDNTRLGTSNIYSAMQPLIRVFKHDNLHCIYMDEYMSSQLEDRLSVTFKALLVDIKLLNWYWPTGQTLRFGRLDPRRWNPDPVDGVRRNATSSPILFTPPGGLNATLEHGWKIIQQTALDIIDRFGHHVLFYPTRKGASWEDAKLIIDVCFMITKISLPTRMTFNELAERIAELHRYPYAISSQWSILDARLDDLRMAAHLPVLKVASQLYEYAFHQTNYETVKMEPGDRRLLRIKQKNAARRLRTTYQKTKIMQSLGIIPKTGVQRPFDINEHIASYVLDPSVFFTVARVDRAVRLNDLERIGWLVNGINPAWLQHMQVLADQDTAAGHANTVNHRRLAAALASLQLRETFKARRNPRSRVNFI